VQPAVTTEFFGVADDAMVVDGARRGTPRGLERQATVYGGPSVFRRFLASARGTPRGSVARPRVTGDVGTRPTGRSVTPEALRQAGGLPAVGPTPSATPLLAPGANGAGAASPAGDAAAGGCAGGAAGAKGSRASRSRSGSSDQRKAAVGGRLGSGRKMLPSMLQGLLRSTSADHRGTKRPAPGGDALPPVAAPAVRGTPAVERRRNRVVLPDVGGGSGRRHRSCDPTPGGASEACVDDHPGALASSGVGGKSGTRSGSADPGRPDPGRQHGRPPLVPGRPTRLAAAVARAQAADSSTSEGRESVLPQSTVSSGRGLSSDPIVTTGRYVDPGCLAAVDTSDDPSLASEYAVSIVQYLMQREGCLRPSPVYMAAVQTMGTTPKHRGILVNWLINVHAKFGMSAQTLFLAVDFLDRFLSVRPVQPDRLQLVGVTCMIIASKYEEIFPPELRDWEGQTDRACCRADMVEAESEVLQVLGFKLTVSTPWQFLSRYLQVLDCGERECHMAQFILEASLCMYDSLRFLPSEIACGAICLGRKLCRSSPAWPPAMEAHTGWTALQLRNGVMQHLLVPTVNKPASHGALVAVRKKFARSTYSAVSSIIELE